VGSNPTGPTKPDRLCVSIGVQHGARRCWVESEPVRCLHSNASNHTSPPLVPMGLERLAGLAFIPPLKHVGFPARARNQLSCAH